MYPYPCNPQAPRAPALYTYYAIISLLVVVLAVGLIWIPFVQLITEVITIVIKVLLYANKELFGNSNDFLCLLEAFLCSQSTLLVISVCCVGFILYLASGNILMFIECYICHLPDGGYLEKIKKIALGIIEYLLHLTGKGKKEVLDENIRINYHDRQNGKN